MLVAWDRIIQLVELTVKNEQPSFHIVGHLTVKFEINCASWIAEDLIYILDNKSLIHIIHASEFKPGEYKPPHDQQPAQLGSSVIIEPKQVQTNTTKTDSSSSASAAGQEFIEYVDLVKSDLLPQSYVKDSRMNPREYYHNAVVTNDREVLILGKRCFYKVELYTWKEYLTKLLEENQWLMFLTVAIEIYHKNIRELGNINANEEDRREEIAEGIEEMVVHFIEVQLFYEIGDEGELEVIKDPDYITEAILSIIDFAVELELYDLLFGKVRQIFAKLKMKDEFLSNLEIFIKLNRIAYIPDNVLREIVYYYIEKGKNKLMQHLILKLDVDRLEITELETICLEGNLNAALIHIVMETGGRYYTIH